MPQVVSSHHSREMLFDFNRTVADRWAGLIGVRADPTAHAALNVLGTSVVMDATVHWNQAVTSQSSSGGAISDASASLTNWLWVDLHVVMTTLGVPVADVDLHLDYGRIAATAGYQPPS